MRKIRVEDAVGETLCHDMTAILESGFKGVKFSRGHIITEEDIPELKKIGKDHIYVWEPEAEEVHEDDAAMQLTEVLCGSGTEYSGPKEGKMTVKAACSGVFVLNRDALKAINRVEDYTVATIPGDTPVQKGQQLAGARIVPLVTKQRNVAEAVTIARAAVPEVFRVVPYQKKKTAFIITGNEVFYGRIPDAFEPILRKKMEPFGAEILGVEKCPDDLESILSAIRHFTAQGAELILLTGGMSVDPDDLTPTAIRQSGARLLFQGVPMQPGNMLTVARLDKTTLIGVPGASMHSKVTSLDVFLPRVMADLPFTKEETQQLGEGGLCMQCGVCTWPACYFGRQ